MKIGVLSDVHDNYYSLFKALDIIKKEGCEHIIFLGDLGHGRMSKIFVNFSITTTMIFGNNDGEKIAMLKNSFEDGSNLNIITEKYGFVEFDSRKIFICHHPELSNSMAKSGDFDAVFFGHTHNFTYYNVGECLVCNPGEIVGWNQGDSSFVIYDTEINNIKKINVNNKIKKIGTFVQEYSNFLNN